MIIQIIFYVKDMLKVEAQALTIIIISIFMFLAIDCRRNPAIYTGNNEKSYQDNNGEFKINKKERISDTKNMKLIGVKEILEWLLFQR